MLQLLSVLILSIVIGGILWVICLDKNGEEKIENIIKKATTMVSGGVDNNVVKKKVHSDEW